jgi:hypothetical protein
MIMNQEELIIALYSPVWFSTDHQIEALISAYQSASFVTKLIGNYKLPKDVASIRGILSPWMRVPLVLTAKGELSITESTISFKHIPHRVFGWIVRSPHKNLTFVLSIKDVTAIEPVDFGSPVARVFDLPFTRIHTAKAAPLDNFLLCIGGYINMPGIRAHSQELRQKLISWSGNTSKRSI